MKDVVEKILQHPIATICILMAGGKAVSSIIRSIKGVKDPILNITITGKDKNNETEQTES